MHDKFSSDDLKAAAGPRKVNEYFASARDFKPPERLFDEFWREGETALFFGEPGTGKSVLAVQIAEAIARGRPIDGFVMPKRRQKVLYVDLKLSTPQFLGRYTLVPAAGRIKQPKFSESFYRDRPPDCEKLCEWLRETVTKGGFRVVILDDISYLSLTYDGTRETLPVMRELRRLSGDLSISLLVLAGSSSPWRGEAAESDLLRSRVLCNAADSVFAIAHHPTLADNRYLIQTRSLNNAVVWNMGNRPCCAMARGEDGFLGFSFDKRFLPELDEETRQLICNVRWAKDAGETFRSMAEYMGISRSKAVRLYKLWTPAMHPPKETLVYDDDDDYYDDIDPDQPPAAVLPDKADSDPAVTEPHDGSAMLGPPEPPSEPFIPESPPFDPLSHLERTQDHDKNEIFVELTDDKGRPLIWYRFDSNGKLTRWHRKGDARIGQTVDGPISLFNTS